MGKYIPPNKIELNEILLKGDVAQLLLTLFHEIAHSTSQAKALDNDFEENMANIHIELGSTRRHEKLPDENYRNKFAERAYEKFIREKWGVLKEFIRQTGPDFRPFEDVKDIKHKMEFDE